MDTLMKVVGPVFVASFALQQLLELLDPILEAIIRNHKKWILSVVSFAGGLLLSIGLGLRILVPLGVSVADWADALITALFLTGGTKGINDLLKLIGYKKQEIRARLSPEQAREV
jgi:dolichol kinase